MPSSTMTPVTPLNHGNGDSDGSSSDGTDDETPNVSAVPSFAESCVTLGLTGKEWQQQIYK